jgi:DNA-binding GntR family transcriptional regulator
MARWVQVVIGPASYALGCWLALQTGLGSQSWDVPHVDVTRSLSVPLHTANIQVALVMVCLGLAVEYSTRYVSGIRFLPSRLDGVISYPSGRGEGNVMRLIPTATLGEQVADGLRTAILKGDFPPGGELKQDRLAEQFGVSRIQVREALQMLERDGLVIVKPNRRVVVSDLADDDIMDHYAVRALIEGEAAARAAAADTDLSRITAAAQWNEEARRAENLGSFLSATAVFHRSIWEAGGGTRLKAVASQLWSGRDYTPAYLPEQLKRATDEHHLIAEAIRLRSPEKARQAMTDHIMRTGNELHAYRAQLAAGNREPNPVVHI